MDKEKQLCPFKRIVERTSGRGKGAVTMRERFDVCAGKRCMAYDWKKDTCKRLEPDRLGR